MTSLKGRLFVAAAVLCLLAPYARALQRGDERNALKSYYTAEYLAFKKRIMAEFVKTGPGKFGEFVKRSKAGKDKGGDKNQKVIAFTFDACGGSHSGYNEKLIAYLRREQIPATLFVTGLWIEQNKAVFAELAKDPLFEIENHGLLHRLCSTEGRMMYGVHATRDLGDVIDEMELCARKIAELTGRRPLFFRSATAYTDELSLKVAARLGMEVVSYDILSGDATKASAKTISGNILKGARHGAVVIMHFNHPEWPDLEAMELVVPELRKRGYNFMKLEDFSVKP
ncbi:MAG: polysaccharide deacetylase family protein [Elusimicrobiota bacterium]|nr:polysaccharide deacetylase family protein [Elusimicrobiota bacterium]